ncbi:MAG TPA: hypothetical protein VGD07_19255, partial [Methylomirabilota bacterium]
MTTARRRRPHPGALAKEVATHGIPVHAVALGTGLLRHRTNGTVLMRLVNRGDAWGRAQRPRARR